MYTIKRTQTMAHIDGITTNTGIPIHDIPASAETGKSYGDLRDAVNALSHTNRVVCRTCRVASEMILLRERHPGSKR